MKKSAFINLIVGTVGGLLFALGMCMCLLQEWNALEAGVVGAYRKIEDSAVSGYQKVENGAVSGFRKISDWFVQKFLSREEETLEETRKRLRRK